MRRAFDVAAVSERVFESLRRRIREEVADACDRLELALRTRAAQLRVARPVAAGIAARLEAAEKILEEVEHGS